MLPDEATRKKGDLEKAICVAVLLSFCFAQYKAIQIVWGLGEQGTPYAEGDIVPRHYVSGIKHSSHVSTYPMQQIQSLQAENNQCRLPLKMRPLSWQAAEWLPGKGDALGQRLFHASSFEESGEGRGNFLVCLSAKRLQWLCIKAMPWR